MYKFIRLPVLRRKLGDPSKSSIYNRVRDELLPPPIKDGSMSIWIEDEVDAVQAYIVAGRNQKELQTLVRDLVAQRTQPVAA